MLPGRAPGGGRPRGLAPLLLVNGLGQLVGEEGRYEEEGGEEYQDVVEERPRLLRRPHEKRVHHALPSAGKKARKLNEFIMPKVGWNQNCMAQGG